MPALAARLNDLGILTVRFPIETVADLYYSIEKLGDLLGQKDAADELESEISSGLDQVSMRVAGEPRVRTMYVIWSDPLGRLPSGSYRRSDLNRWWPERLFRCSGQVAQCGIRIDSGKESLDTSVA